MFTITAHHSQYLRMGQDTMQAVLSVSVDASMQMAPAPLALGIALDHSGSMEGPKMRAARDGAIKVVQAIDASMAFMVVTFNDNARVIFGPAMGSDANKRHAVETLKNIYASGGTRMSTALNAIVDKFSSKDQGRATKILFLTDGKNEGEQRSALDRAVARCANANISISAWGVGTNWDAAELRHIADATHGTADIIPSPKQIEAAFTASFSEMRKTAIPNASMYLWSPMGVTIKRVEQVYPNIVALGTEPDPANPRQVVVNLGSFAAGDQRDYLVTLQTPAYQPGQQFLLLRPGLKYFLGGADEQEEKSFRDGWVFVQWTEDAALAAQIDPHIAHYTNQEELSQAIREGQAALAAGDSARATHLLSRALEISKRTGNERITRLINDIVQENPDGSYRLNQQADAVARKTLAINVGRTSKLK
ncbi:MAG TPA: vWA domain-containing protein [Ktedonosporobacter sp.]|jgi:hypothetical protein|nr:vWA domain-containing protein [Ktedonosporobacter sp.]